MMNFSHLIKDGRLKRGRFSKKQVEDRLALARRDLETARSIVESSSDWSFNIAYNAMHQAGRALMFHRGYRVSGIAHHVTVVEFMKEALDQEHQDIIEMMDRMRRKRNRSTYDKVGSISQKEAREALSVAREFVELVADILGR